jgi:4-aminobutyrate aminotransferase/(S)-3-amino-2-methylpropionate transaminase
MIGFDVVTADGQPDGMGAKAVAARALERGLILLTCGVHGETIRVLAPLTIPFEQLDEGLDILEDSLRLDVA